MFYTVDSRAREEYGLGFSVGKCVLGGLPNIVDLCSYILNNRFSSLDCFSLICTYMYNRIVLNK